MFEATFTRTQRRALLDNQAGNRLAFAKRTVAWARDNGHDALVWYFSAKQSVGYLREPELASATRQLQRTGQVTLGGVQIVLATRRMSVQPGGFKAPLAAWWPDDYQLLALDSTHRPLLDALISNTHRAPIWLTAFDVDVDEEVGVRDPDSGLPGIPASVRPIEITDELQAMVTSRSASITLSTNGVHDSLGPPLVAAARAMIRSGAATPEAVAVAAIRAGWWPEKVPALIDKVGR